MTHDEKLEALRAELAKQDEALAAVKAALESAGDVELPVPASFLEELEAITTVHAVAAPTPAFAMRV